MLTNAKAKAARPAAKIYELNADDRGLKLRILPSGLKSWAMRYRNKSGDRRRVTLGLFPEISLATARKEAAALRDRIRLGEDPNEQAAAERAALRMADLFGETGPRPGEGRLPVSDKTPGWYLGTYVKHAGKLGTSKTEHSIRTDRVYIAKHIRPRKRLMAKRVDAVTVADMERIEANLSPGAWRKVRNILRVTFRHAEELGIIPHGSNPAARVKATPDRKVERYLSPAAERAPILFA